MEIGDKIKNKNLQSDINREVRKTSALSSCKTDKYKHLAGKKVLLSDQRRVIEQAKFTYSQLGKALKIETKAIENQGEKQMKGIEEHGNQLVLSNALAKKLIMIAKKITKRSTSLKKIFLINLVMKE